MSVIKGVSLLEVSVYHNVIFSVTKNVERVNIYDYEHSRLLNYIEFDTHVEPTAISTLLGYPILIIATSDNLMYIVHFVKKESIVEFQLLGIVNIYESVNIL